MNTELLRTFLEVAKTRHFGHAAENLFLTQSAVSSRIKQLEESIGANIFKRQRNNLLLTPAGERLLPHAENILAAWQLAVQEAGVPKTQNIQVALGGTYNLWDTYLQGILPALGKSFPNLYIRTEINQPQHLIRSLLGGRVDIFAVLDAPQNVDIVSQVIGQLELVMVCNRADMHLHDVPDIGHVFVDWGTAINIQQARLFPEPVAPILHTGQSQIALEFILHHTGAAYLPKLLVSGYLARGNLYRVQGATTINQDVHIVYSKGADQNEKTGPIIRFFENRQLPTCPRN